MRRADHPDRDVGVTSYQVFVAVGEREFERDVWIFVSEIRKERRQNSAAHDFALMSIRNHIVRQLGLKDVGSMSGETGKAASEYQIGDRLGIFTIMGQTKDELLLGIDDSHLDVRVSVLKLSRQSSLGYVVSTVVHVHNWLGRVYMAPVGRIHPLVVRAMMRRTSV